MVISHLSSFSTTTTCLEPSSAMVQERASHTNVCMVITRMLVEIRGTQLSVSTQTQVHMLTQLKDYDGVTLTEEPTEVTSSVDPVETLLEHTSG